jgi:hypothetical protein
MAVKKASGATGSGHERCPVASERGGVLYRCSKRAGHELRDPGDWEHVADPVEYARPAADFRRLFEDALPLLHHAAERDADPHRREQARRLIIRYHMIAPEPAPRDGRTLA